MQWRGLTLTGAWCAFASVVLIVLHVPIFLVWPPPELTAEFFELLLESPTLGLILLDLPLLVSNLLAYVLYIMLTVPLWRVNRSKV